MSAFLPPGALGPASPSAPPKLALRLPTVCPSTKSRRAAYVSIRASNQENDADAARAAVLRALDEDLESLVAAEKEKREAEERLREEAEQRAEDRLLNPPTNRRFFVAFDLPDVVRQRISALRSQARHDFEQGELDYLLAREVKDGIEENRDARGGRLLTWVREPANGEWRAVLNFVGTTNHDAIDSIREALEKAVVKVPVFQVAVSDNVLSYYPGMSARTRNFHVGLRAADGSRMLDNLALVIKNELDVLKGSKLGKSLNLKLKKPPKLKGDAEERRKVRQRISKLPTEYQEGFSSTVTLAHVDFYASTRERVRCFKSVKPGKFPKFKEELIFPLEKITLFEQIVESGKPPVYNPLTSVSLPKQDLPKVTVLRERDEDTHLLDDPYSQTQTEDEMSQIVEIHDEPNEMEDTLFYRNRLHVNLRIQGDPNR